MKKVIILNAPANCVDPDTEFLSNKGWIKISEWKGEDILVFDKEKEDFFFSEPLDFIKRKTKDNLLGYKTNHLDILCTENHNILYKTCRGNWAEKNWGDIYKKLKTNKTGFDARLPSNIYKTRNQGLDIEDVILQLTVAISADSSKISAGNYEYCFNLKKDHKKQRLKNLLNKTNFEWKTYEFESMEGYTRFVVNTEGKIKKGLPSEWFSLNNRQRQLVGKELVLWDGDQDCRFFTNIKQEADLAQYCLESLGFSCTLKETFRQDKKTPYEYTVSLCKRRKYKTLETRIVKKQNFYETPSRDNHVYCFTTETGYWLARKNDKIYVTGNSGKDHGAEVLCKYFYSIGLPAHHKEFKKALFKAVKSAYGIDEEQWKLLYTRTSKEQPSEFLIYNGEPISPRQAMINMSENVMKPLFGSDVFGKAAAFDLLEGFNVFSDGGFEEEIEPLINEVGKSNILIIKISRDGCTFEGDSRNYIDVDGVRSVELHNEGDETFEELLIEIVEDWLDE